MCERTFSGALGPYFAQIKQIAAGGNGRVLSAIDTRFDFPVCIKRISVANKDECRAALREIRIRRRLRHENIVGLLNAIVSDGTDVSEITPANFSETSCIYLVQELLDADLRQVIESQTRLSDDYVKLFFYQLLRGMKYIHSANVLHRDLKPSNVMINVNSLQLMIGDFGHSVVLDPRYSHGNSVTVCDTSLWYKAPELILKTAQYSTASDIWAVGCILAEMLLGRPLFEGENDLEQLELIIHAIKVPPKDQSNIRSFLTHEVNTMYNGKPKFPLQTKFQKVDFQALHLLEHLLSFNPEDRVTIELALSHPFLNEYACFADEPVCLKPLHLEHEVDDFLEYTLKDLIVGECVSLAEEQPRIHLQMSSYSSLTDISKDSHVSPSESTSHSMEERNSLDLKAVSEDHHEELSNESEGSRFKVLEVLKEEHGSSSDSNGLATHEEGVSEAPMVLDHPMFSSSKLEKERHSKTVHRRHHHHRRKKKHHLKSPFSETEPLLDLNNARLPEVHVSEADALENNVPKLDILVAEEHPPEVTKLPPDAVAIHAQDDKVHELIMRSRQLIADQNTVMNEVPAITDICCSVATNSCPTDVCSSLPCISPMTCDSLSTKPSLNDSCAAVPSCYSPDNDPVVPMETEEGNHDSQDVKNISLSVGDFRIPTLPAVDLGVAEVVRRSQELLGDVYKPSSLEDDPVKDLITRSEQLIQSKEVGLVQNLDAAEEKNVPTDKIDPVQDLVARSEQLLNSEEIRELNLGKCEENVSDSVQDLISKYEQLVKSSEPKNKFYNYPPPFTEKLVDLTIQSPPVNHLAMNNPNLLSKAKENASRGNTVNQPQPMPNDPCHRRTSDKRLQELLEESQSLVSSLKTDQLPCQELESALTVEEQSESNSNENFSKGLDRIDLNEVKQVLDQAQKLLEKSDELCTNKSLEVDQPADTMDVDVLMKDTSGGVVRNTTLAFGKNGTEDVMKSFSHFQNQVDVVTGEPLATNEHAAVYNIYIIPSAMNQTTRLNCLTSLKDSSGCRFARKQQLVKKRSHETVSKTDGNNAHKNFKNSSVTPPDVSLLTAVSDAVGDTRDKEIGVKQSGLDLIIDDRLIADSNCKSDMKNEGSFKGGKNSPDHEVISGRNTDPISSMIEHINSDEVVEKLCGNTCRIESNTNRLNSKDSAGLQNFYAALKIESIMRSRRRPRREMRHDTYPF